MPQPDDESNSQQPTPTVLKTKLIPALERDSNWLVVVLHGLGDSMAGYEWLPLALRLPWLNYLLVNAPDPYYGGFSWYDFAGDPRPGVERSRRALFHLLDQQRQRGVPTDQTLLFGFSQGCLMVIDVGLRYPACLAGIIGISGYVFEPEELIRDLSPPAKAQRLLLTHGMQDPMIPFKAVREQVALLKGAQLNVEWHEFVKEHTIAGEQEIAVVREFIKRSRS